MRSMRRDVDDEPDPHVAWQQRCRNIDAEMDAGWRQAREMAPSRTSTAGARNAP
jgi:hypothetical protein